MHQHRIAIRPLSHTSRTLRTTYVLNLTIGQVSIQNSDWSKFALPSKDDRVDAVQYP
jgi:hypothetical protein